MRIPLNHLIKAQIKPLNPRTEYGNFKSSHHFLLIFCKWLSSQPNDAWLACHVGNSKENSGLSNAPVSETSKLTRNVTLLLLSQISNSNVYNDDE